MNISLKTITLAALVAGAIVLSSCSPTATNVAPTTAPTASAVETPAPAETETETAEKPEAEEPERVTQAPADLKAGDTVPAAVAEELNANFIFPGDDDRAYKTKDGEYILIEAGEPLPKPIVTEVKNKTLSAAPTLGTARGEAANAPAVAFDEALDAAKKETGRTFAPVAHLMSYNPSTDGYYAGWFIGGDARLGEFPSKSAAVAAAKAWVAESPNVRDYIVLDYLG